MRVDSRKQTRRFFKAVEYDPSDDNVTGLADRTREAREPAWDAANAAKEKGNAAFQSKNWGLAIAHYTVAVALVPSNDTVKGDWNAVGALGYLRCVLLANRSGAFLRLQRFTSAIADGRSAVGHKPDSCRAHMHHGAALLGAGQVEQAYTEFAWALSINPHHESARRGHTAAMYMVPLWSSIAARARRRDRFAKDLCRPADSTKVWAISDIHLQHRPNEEWIHSLDNAEFQEDVLVVAGNVGDNLNNIQRGLRTLRAKFRRVFYVPGNEDLALNPAEVRLSMFPDSFSKLLSILSTCDDLDVDVFPAAIANDLYIVPLFTWYNSQFDHTSRPNPNHGQDAGCVWPLDPMLEMWQYFIKLNQVACERTYKGTVITVSHFLPLSTLPFHNDGVSAQAMGCEDIEDLIRQARSKMHIYGHSMNRTVEDHGNILFVNQWHGYQGVENLGNQDSKPLCVYDGPNCKGFCVTDKKLEARARENQD